ncbi:hypothetical protein KO528_15730 [Saccharophagus degradans]|uniref:Transmembrane protein n=1 Tax=Saccharophagus degradans TaxID=86304 RepID=A0AAW7XEN2_9GAMM|nr:hypothetical protein [Saccharophagus degradans]MBU2986815.1 hypothetical protein [Saccharophagus degradans]MDO6424834.1 hypothetical protein [Saccharophagus degradans]MDO6606622.1 hypothetical protein [Saccharophagus degradans]
MNPNIPIPTDSVHKFYAGFGLVVFIASLIAAVYVQNSTNEKIMKWFDDSAQIEKLEKKTDVDRVQLKRIDELINITKKDKKTFLYFLISSAFFGLFVAGWGFQAWEKKVQPQIDKKMELELELLELEIESKKRSNKQLQRSRFARR